MPRSEGDTKAKRHDSTSTNDEQNHLTRRQAGGLFLAATLDHSGRLLLLFVLNGIASLFSQHNIALAQHSVLLAQLHLMQSQNRIRLSQQNLLVSQHIGLQVPRTRVHRHMIALHCHTPSPHPFQNRQGYIGLRKGGGHFAGAFCGE